MKRKWTLIVFLIILTAGWGLYSDYATGKDKYQDVDEDMEDMWDVYKKILYHYYKELEPDDVLETGIEGMLSDLDPYSQFLNERAAEQLRIDTKGEFGGLGISISQKDSYPTVIWTLEGTPADKVGLLAGDRIVKIEGEPTREKSLGGVVALLRGVPGTQVNITVAREGLDTPIEFSIIRAVITIKSVSFADVIDDSIGYIRMFQTRFSEDTERDIQKALFKFKQEGAKGIILDLRNNPGGLLPQATEVADKFLKKGDTILSTRGRGPGQERIYRAEQDPVIEDVPLIVLVNSQSASAAEVVAGAIQDSDRGLILGATTFGKGSVQTVMNVGDGSLLKLTTALYYTPSGRSIHKDRKGLGGIIPVDGRLISIDALISIMKDATDEDSMKSLLMEKLGLTYNQAEFLMNKNLDQLVSQAARESNSEKEKKFTAGGRTVYGGGGIDPDIVVNDDIPRYALELMKKRMFFSFAVHYAASHPNMGRNFELDDDAIAQFREFIADSSRGFDYVVEGEMQLEDLEEILNKNGYSQEAGTHLQIVKKQIEEQEEKDFQESLEYIKGSIAMQIASRLWGEEARYRAGFAIDKQLKTAIDILKDRKVYEEYLKGTELARGNDIPGQGK